MMCNWPSVSICLCDEGDTREGNLSPALFKVAVNEAYKHSDKLN